MEDCYSSIKSIFDIQYSTRLILLTFSNNLALFGGIQIYGGWLDWFEGEDGKIRYEPDTMKPILNFEKSSGSDIASCPIQVCLCKDGNPDCSITNTVMEINFMDMLLLACTW